MYHLFGKHSLRLISKYWWFWSIWRTAAYISYVFEIRDSVEPPWMSGVDRFHDNVMIRFISAWIIKVESTLWLPWAANISKAYPGLIHKINLAAKAKRRKSMKFKMKALTAVDPRSGSFFLWVGCLCEVEINLFWVIKNMFQICGEKLKGKVSIPCFH